MKDSEHTILSCDWGTTYIRLRRVDVATGAVLGEAVDRRGVKSVYAEWKSAGGERRSVYFKVLHDLAHRLERRSSDTAILISGMATSSMGLKELPYAEIPFRLDGSDLVCDVLFDADLRLPVVLVSGLRTKDDVMRGEETELIGLHRHRADSPGTFTYILPGTHSKHVYVQDGVVAGFDTYMTGEVFEVMLEASILGSSVKAGPLNEAAVAEGAREARRRPLLASLFSVRTHALLGKRPPETNYWFLSGLLVGSELVGVLERSPGELVFCCTPAHDPVYRAAFGALESGEDADFRAPAKVARASVDGHLAAYGLMAAELPRIGNAGSGS